MLTDYSSKKAKEGGVIAEKGQELPDGRLWVYPIFMYMGILLGYMYHIWTVTVEARRGCQIRRDWSYS